jgi:hypothetical protein
MRRMAVDCLPAAEGGNVPARSVPGPGTTTIDTERITVALIPRSAADLQYLVDATGLSKTDLVNRALQLYKWVEESLAAGQEVTIRDKATGEVQVVKFI